MSNTSTSLINSVKTKRDNMKTWSIVAVEVSMALSGLFMIILMAIVAV